MIDDVKPQSDTSISRLRAKSITQRILTIRGHRVMIDADLAEVYGVPTKALNQAVKRNTDRFPEDFAFRLTAEEKAELVTNCDRFNRLKHSAASPLAFTEHGVIMAANVMIPGGPSKGASKSSGSSSICVRYWYRVENSLSASASSRASMTHIFEWVSTRFEH